MVLQLPQTSQEKKNETESFIYEVLPKETLYGISKKFNVTIDDIKQANPFIATEGLKVGVKIQIKSDKQKENSKLISKQIDNEVKPVLLVNQEEVVHEVLPKETKYGISKKYGVTIAELETLNPEIKLELPIGYKLIIKKGLSKINTPVVESANKQIKIVEIKPHVEDEEEEETIESDDKKIEIASPSLPEIEEAPPISEENMTKVDFMISRASENIGVRYRSGGTDKAGFDCSGLMITTFKEIEMALPRTSAEQSRFGLRIDKAQAQKGDLIFFTTNGRGNINHVGMVTEVLEDEIKFIHASVHAGVIVSSTKEAYYAKRFVQVNRVLTE
jgi:peptidoglycan DL-endopeptidase LytE